jgi:2-polyprenyl-3-methyl-5-hydroxy-6-metoxy-1,4-benzoquinol methylase
MPTSTADTARCWICGAVGRPFRASTIRQQIDPSSVRITDSNYGQTAALSKCTACGFVFADPVPHPDVLGLYRGMDDQPYQDTSTARRAQMRLLLDVAAQYRPHARTLLDIGAGTGLMVSEARARGLDAHGVEPSRWCVDTAAAINKVDLFCGTVADVRNRLGHYDIVNLVDVIEHTIEPMQMLREAASLLSATGVLLIVTPDIGSATARLMRRWWWHHRVAHVGYFDRASMRRAVHEAGLVLEGDRPATWRFPASYLAERLVRYVPIVPVSTLLNRLARSPRAHHYEIPVNTFDSRVFIASTGAR